MFRCGAEKATPPPPLNLLVKIAGKLVVVRSGAVHRVRRTQICTRVQTAFLQGVQTAFLQDRTVELCPGPYCGPRGGGAVSCERGTPVQYEERGEHRRPSLLKGKLSISTPFFGNWSHGELGGG